MAVGHDRIISEIEKHAAQAKTQDDAKMRESIAAIRALCNLLLDGDERAATITPPRATPLASSPKPQITLSEQKLAEEDANGDSLFEF